MARDDGKYIFSLDYMRRSGARGTLAARARNSTRNRKVKVSLSPVTFGEPAVEAPPVYLAATGHRPDKLQGIPHDRLLYLAETALRAEPTPLSRVRAISGLAQGWDTYWALAAYKLEIPLIAAIPFPDQAKNWPALDRKIYAALLAAASRVVVVNPGPPARWKYHARNRWMVYHADVVVALWNGSPGGTASTVRYAQKCGKPVRNLWDQLR